MRYHSRTRKNRSRYLNGRTFWTASIVNRTSTADATMLMRILWINASKFYQSAAEILSIRIKNCWLKPKYLHTRNWLCLQQEKISTIILFKGVTGNLTTFDSKWYTFEYNRLKFYWKKKLNESWWFFKSNFLNQYIFISLCVLLLSLSSVDISIFTSGWKMDQHWGGHYFIKVTTVSTMWQL